MYSIKNDYSEGAHPRILESLVDSNFIQQAGYSEDDYSIRAKELLKSKINNDKARVFFVSGGTQANLVVISALLLPHEAVICAESGHIYANETGAIEATGHRIITVKTKEGKLCPQDIDKVFQEYTLRPHVVKPKMIYISNSTELGTIYNKEELGDLSAYCKKQKLYLYMDGARIGNALTAADNDLTLQMISEFTDVFYIGGTKNGAIFGEAIIFNNTDLAPEFDYILKQKGALLSKGRFFGIQFLELFKDDLYFTLAKHANDMAMIISDSIKDKGYSFLTKSKTNQIFPILPKSIINTLNKKYQFYIWKNIEPEYAAIRIITSWATEERLIREFIKDFTKALQK